MPGVSPQLVIGSLTEVISGTHLILTAGTIDAHVHFICPQQLTEALTAGTTTFIGGGEVPALAPVPRHARAQSSTCSI